jgi:GT2 family glycosyltransferase
MKHLFRKCANEVFFMADTGKVGVVTVTYNSAGVLDDFIVSLLCQTHGDFILYAVDNASADRTLDKLSEYKDPRINVIANKNNVGVAEGNNQGVRAAFAAGCDSILFINNDTVFDPSLIESLVKGMKQHGADMIAPKILFHDNPTLIWCAGGGFKPAKGYVGVHYGMGEVDRGQFDTVRRLDHAPTCCLLVRRSVFDKIGLMDARYFVYIDDADFCFRARQAGMKLVYLPSATLLHKASSLTGGAESEFAVRYSTRNHIYFMLKNLGPWLGLYFLPEYQVRLCAKFLLRKIKFSEFVLQQKAFFEGLRMWRHSVAQ